MSSDATGASSSFSVAPKPTPYLLWVDYVGDDDPECAWTNLRHLITQGVGYTSPDREGFIWMRPSATATSRNLFRGSTLHGHATCLEIVNMFVRALRARLRDAGLEGRLDAKFTMCNTVTVIKHVGANAVELEPLGPVVVDGRTIPQSD